MRVPLTGYQKRVLAEIAHRPGSHPRKDALGSWHDALRMLRWRNLVAFIEPGKESDREGWYVTEAGEALL